MTTAVLHDTEYEVERAIDASNGFPLRMTSAEFEAVVSREMQGLVSFRRIPMDEILSSYDSTDLDCYCTCEPEDVNEDFYMFRHKEKCWLDMFNIMSKISDSFMEVLDEVYHVGFCSYVAIDQESDGTMVVVNGHHRLAVLHRRGYTHVPCVIAQTDGPWSTVSQESSFMRTLLRNGRGYHASVAFDVSEDVRLMDTTI